ncbi:MAG: hypothetical protein ACO2Z9_02645 [Crocinitomicaceae bacterium]
MKRILSFLAFAVSLQLGAQKIEPKFSYNLELGLPNAAVNEPYKDIMQGLVSVAMFGQYSFPFHLNVGAGARYSLFTVNEFSVPDELSGQIHSASGFIKLGYDKFHNERFATDFGVKIGYGQNIINTDLNDESGVGTVKVNSSFVEPGIAFILSVDQWNSFRLHVGYNIMGYGFRPQLLGLTSDETWNPNDYDKLTQAFVIGFGYTYYFNKDKPRD